MGCRKKHRERYSNADRMAEIARRYAEVMGEEVEVIVEYENGDPMYNFTPVETDGVVTYKIRDENNEENHTFDNNNLKTKK